MLASLASYNDLVARSTEAGLGNDLVVQTAYGDSGHTTFFIKNKKDWNKHVEEIVGEGDTKIMKRIACRQAAIKGCTTKAGTILGPLMTEIVGFEELPPYKGGWAGSEIFAESFMPEIRTKSRDLTFRFDELNNRAPGSTAFTPTTRSWPWSAMRHRDRRGSSRARLRFSEFGLASSCR